MTTTADGGTAATAVATPASDGFVRVNGLRLHYRRWKGAGGTNLLLLHGGSAHTHWWDWFAPTVADRFDVTALDLRGHGDSEWASNAAYGVDDYAGDVVAVADALDFREVTLVGHSLGGVIAVEAAARLGPRTTALVIVDSRIKSHGDGGRFMQRLAQIPPPRYRSLEQGIALYRLLPVGSTAPPDVLAQIAAHALRRREEDARWTFKFDRAALAAIGPHDVSGALSQLRCPILAVRGAASPLMPPAAIAALRVLAPQLQDVEIAGAHHHVMLDRPAQFAAAVGGFLADATRDA